MSERVACYICIVRQGEHLHGVAYTHFAGNATNAAKLSEAGLDEAPWLARVAEAVAACAYRTRRARYS